MTLAVQLADKYSSVTTKNGKQSLVCELGIRPLVLAAINEAIERCAQEADSAMLIWQAERQVCVDIGARIRDLKDSAV